MRVLIIIPAYNEAGNVNKVVDNIIENYPQYDYVIVNDASSDGTKDTCIANQYCFLDQPINLGIGGTVQNGYQYALENDYDVAVQIDGDIRLQRQLFSQKGYRFSGNLLPFLHAAG